MIFKKIGIGGRLDSTNIINPLLSIITSIGFDHCEILGDTYEKIAFEKAGIIKQNTPVVLGTELPYEYLSKIAKEKGAPVIPSPEQAKITNLPCSLHAMHQNILEYIY